LQLIVDKLVLFGIINSNLFFKAIQMSDRTNSQKDVYGLDKLAEVMEAGGAIFEELPKETEETRSQLKLVVDNPEEKTA
jgi:hypothetical protein